MANESNSATATLQVPLFDSLGHEQELLCQWSLTTPVELQNYVVLNAGFTDIRPALAGSVFQLLIIVPPPGVNDTWILKGVSGDQGLTISSTFPTFIPSPSSTVLGITATTGGYTILTRWFR